MKNIYTLTYRFGSNPHPMLMNFQFDGSLVDAIARGRKFCDTVGYRFHSVRPLIENLETIEKRHTGVDTSYPAQSRGPDLSNIDANNPNAIIATK